MDNSRYINREMSWLEFNARVLDEAVDEGNPLLERLKFLAIFSSNLDEFFMVRVAAINKQIESGETKFLHGYNPQETLDEIERRVRTLVTRQYRYLYEDILPALASNGIIIIRHEDLSPSQQQKLKIAFSENIFPVLTPVAIDQSHPFPVVKNGAVELLVCLEPGEEEKERYAIIEVPDILPRFVAVEKNEEHALLLPVEYLISAHLDMLLPGCKIKEQGLFRITRDMDISIDDESAADLLAEIQVEMQKKSRREVIRLELGSGISPKARRWLEKKLDVSDQMIHSIPGLLNLKRLFEIVALPGFQKLRDRELPPLPSAQLDPEKSIFDTIRNSGDIVLHHPYESFTPVIRFLDEAASDPNVLAIKQTLYRVSGDSPVVRALVKAARNGKQVTVLIELRARFDEENNILWARELAEAGAHVVYGLAGLKVHCKTLLVIRREPEGIRRYFHLSTGNYNDKTAKAYTDLGLFGCDKLLADDLSALFNVITGFAKPPVWRKLIVAPFNMKERLVFLIEREANLSTKENPGHIIFKINSLIDSDVMEALYLAAKKNVRIDLIVRGICGINPYCLEKSAAARINVVSVVDRFLEHSRIYYFRNNGTADYYIGSADVMPRNLYSRIEILFPIDNDGVRAELDAIMRFALEDHRKGRRMTGPNRYTRTIKASEQEKTRSQLRLYKYYQQKLAQRQEEAAQVPQITVFRTPPGALKQRLGTDGKDNE